MSHSSFDPVAYKQAQHEQWNEDAAGWNRWGPTLEHWFHDVTQIMLDFADLQPGSRVLDIASGAGEPALSAAERVGPDGYVLATDLSEGILEYARQNAAHRGFDNVDLRKMDGEDLSLDSDAFDAVLCRVSLMYLPNTVRALSEWRRVLRPGGHAVVAVYTAPERNPWGSVPMGIIRERAQVPPPLPGQPGPFRLADESELRGMFEQAGFRSFDTRIQSAPVHMASAADYTRFAREAFGAFNAVMVHLPREERAEVWDAVEVAMRQFEHDGGIEVPGEVLIACGVK